MSRIGPQPLPDQRQRPAEPRGEQAAPRLIPGGGLVFDVVGLAEEEQGLLTLFGRERVPEGGLDVGDGGGHVLREHHPAEDLGRPEVEADRISLLIFQARLARINVWVDVSSAGRAEFWHLGPAAALILLSVWPAMRLVDRAPLLQTLDRG